MGKTRQSEMKHVAGWLRIVVGAPILLATHLGIGTVVLLADEMVTPYYVPGKLYDDVYKDGPKGPDIDTPSLFQKYASRKTEGSKSAGQIPVSQDALKVSDLLTRLLQIRDNYFIGWQATATAQQQVNWGSVLGSWAAAFSAGYSGTNYNANDYDYYPNREYIDQTIFNTKAYAENLLRDVRETPRPADSELDDALTRIERAAEEYLESLTHFVEQRYPDASAKSNTAWENTSSAIHKLSPFGINAPPNYKKFFIPLIRNHETYEHLVNPNPDRLIIGFEFAFSTEEIFVISLIEKAPAQRVLRVGDSITGYYQGKERRAFANIGDFFAWMDTLDGKKSQKLEIKREGKIKTVWITPKRLK